MIKINFRIWEENEKIQKNILYKIEKPVTVSFTEEHGESRETVEVEYDLKEGGYGIFAHEYRSPSTSKQGCKTADILACAVDDADKKIDTFIADIKSNISAFSDDLLKDNALLTAIKEVRDFTEQIHAEILHKESFMLYYKDAGYEEEERIGIVTKNFERGKFAAVSEMLEKLFREESPPMPMLTALKLKKNLAPYMGEADKIRNFADRIVKISGRVYSLQVFLLDRISEREYRTSVKVGSGEH